MSDSFHKWTLRFFDIQVFELKADLRDTVDCLSIAIPPWAMRKKYQKNASFTVYFPFTKFDPLRPYLIVFIDYNVDA